MEHAWRPSQLEDGQYATDVAVFRFRIEDWSGVKQEELSQDGTATDG